MCINIGLTAIISVDKSNDKFHAKLISNFANNFADDFADSFRSNNDSSLVFFKLSFKTAPTPPP